MASGGRHLASHGYTVLLPRHPGSDRSQQQAMLSGQMPPPSPDGLKLRPMDMSAVIDAAAAGSLALPAGLRTDSVVAMGQSYGATTVLQLAGGRGVYVLDGHRLSVRSVSRSLEFLAAGIVLTLATGVALW